MAAALFESLLMNHAFVDGNKRVAFFAFFVFLAASSGKCAGLKLSSKMKLRSNVVRTPMLI